MSNLCSFNKAVPFDYETNPLPLEVNSDHATIKCRLEYADSTTFTISASNISNKEYHKYNKSGPLYKSHMYVPTNNSEWLLTKTQFQLDQLLTEMASLDVQVILEGFYDFYQDMLKTKDSAYTLISLLDEPQHKFTGSPKNIAGILVNTSRASITERGIMTVVYDNDKKFKVPWVKITKSEVLEKELVICAVHLPGNNEQFPKTALEALHTSLKNYITYNTDVIAIGDFNTVPENIEIVTKTSELFKVLEPKYLTHFNPYNQVAVYDNVVYHLNSKDTTISLLDRGNLPTDSVKLIESLEQCYRLSL